MPMENERTTLGVNGYTVQPIVAMQNIQVGTWAQRAVIGAFGTTRGLAFFTDVGEHGTLMQWTGTRWRALNGEAALKTIGAASANIANSETIVLQALLPAGTWQVNDILRLWLTSSKSGTTDTCNLTVRVGTAGTTGDTAITGLSAYALMAASGITGGSIFDVKLNSATAAQKVGASGASAQHGYQTASAAATAAATTITDASTNDLYVSVALASSGTTNTVVATSGKIQLITP